jgi:amino acid permease
VVLYLPWIGWGEIVLMIFLAFINLDTKMGYWGILINYFFSLIVFASGYSVIITTLFPQAIQDIRAQSQVQDPLEDLPKNIREIMDDGRTSIGMATISTLAVFIVMVVASIIFIGGLESPLVFIAIEICAVIIIGLIARFFAIQKWQKQAMQMGIPEKELKSAAELAGLPWPKIKEE